MAPGCGLADIRGKPFWEARWFQVSRESIEQQRDFIRRARGGEFIRCDLEVYGQAAGDETIVVDYSHAARERRARATWFSCWPKAATSPPKNAPRRDRRAKNAELESLLDRILQLDQQKNDFFANVSHELRTAPGPDPGPGGRTAGHRRQPVRGGSGASSA